MLAILVLMATLAAGLFWPGALWAGCFFTYQVASITENDKISMVYVVLAVGVAAFHALRRPPPVAFGLLDAVFALFIGAFALSSTYMPDGAGGATAAGQLLLSVVTMYIVGRLTCWPERLTQTVREMLVTLLIVGSILAFIIFHGRVKTVVRVARLAVGTGTDVGISGPFPFILVGGVAGIFYFSNRRQMALAALSVLALAIVGYVSIYSATRGVYVAAIGGLGVLYLAGRQEIKLQGAIMLGVVGLIGLAVAIPFMPHTLELQNAIMRLVGNVHGGKVVLDDAALERLNNFRMATALFLQHPIMGMGIGGFTFATGINYPHNLFIETACDFGLVGLCLLVLYLAVLFRSGFRLAQTYPEAGSIMIGFAAVHLTHMLVSDTLSHAKVVFMFTSVIAGALAALDSYRTKAIAALTSSAAA